MATDATAPADRALATGYLEHLARLGVDPAELTATAEASELLAVAYRGRFLPSPVFLEQGESSGLAEDLLTVHTMLTELPDRIFGGSRAALGRAIGLTDAQISVVDRAPAGPLIPMARSDLYRTGDGFKLLELNITSALGGFENAEINRAMLEHPALAEFVSGRDLGYRDTLRAIVDTMRHELGDRVAGERLVVALADWPESFKTYEPRLHVMADLLGRLGIDAIPCHVGMLTEHDGGIAVDGRRVDVVFRFFLLEEIVTDEDLALVEHVLSAVERGTVTLFARVDAELYGNKGALAMLSDDRNAQVFTEAERECVRRFLPWTRFLVPTGTDPAGEPVDLIAHAVANQADLILKPTMLHGGSGIVAGWTVGADEWVARLGGALDGPYVLQQRVRPAPEPFPVVGGAGRQDLYLNWGVFVGDPAVLGTDGYAGCIVRGTTDSEVGVVSMGAGARVGCCFQSNPE